jgi:hypothetical protein
MQQQDKVPQPKLTRTELIWDGKYDAGESLRCELNSQHLEKEYETAAIGRTRFRGRDYRPTAVHVAIEAIADPAALAKPIVEITREDPAQKQSAGKEPGQQPTGINLDRAPPQRTLKLRDLFRVRRWTFEE